MVELRYVVRGLERVLQYRQLAPLPYRLEEGQEREWGEWRDVPVEREE